MPRLSLLLAAFSTLAWAAACGSQVVDPPDTTSTGAGGATTSSTGATTTTTTTGTTTSGTGGAATADDTYRAVNMITSIPRFAILKASPSRQLCFRLMVMPSQSTGIGIYGDGFTVMSAEVTDDPSDCDFPPGFAPPADGPSFSTSAPSSMGGLGFTQSPAGCQVGVNATLKLPGAPAWAPVQEQLYTSQPLTIEGGCP